MKWFKDMNAFEQVWCAWYLLMAFIFGCVLVVAVFGQ